LSRTCRKCEKEYQPYLILIPDNIVDLSSVISVKEEYEWLCQPCIKEELPNNSGVVLTDTGESDE
jgi:hypothetical protein